MKTLVLITVTMLVFVSAGCSQMNQGSATMNENQEIQNDELMSIPFKNIDGIPVSLDTYRNKAMLVVNVASKCGFTPQYEGLEKLYRTYKDSGFVILGFPANNFLKQEPGTDEEIKLFCTTNYDVSFPMMSKISVKGKEMHPLYISLVEMSPEKKGVSWNFNKFLVDENGQVVKHFGSRTKPDDEELLAEIKKLLGE